MARQAGKKVRITVSLEEEVYERIKKVSSQIGLLPATWVSMVATSKANNLEITVNHEKNGGV